MKKVISLVAVMLLISSTSLFAADAGSEFTSTAGAEVKVGTTTADKDLIKLSNNVILKAFINDTKTAYSMSSKHNSAPREYATSSGDTKLYYQDLATAETDMTTLTAADSSDFDDWKSM